MPLHSPRRRFNRYPLALAIACATLTCASTIAPFAHAEQGTAVRSYAIPAGPLTAALNRFAEESGVYLAGNAQLTANKNSPGLHGSFPVEQALGALLAGTGLEAVQQANGSYSLRAADIQLRAVNVRDRADLRTDESAPAYAGGQVARGGRFGMLGNKDIMDAPFNIAAFTAQTVNDQQARSIADILVNDPSAQLSSARTNIGEDFSLRGFPMASQDVALNGMYGLMPYFRVPVEMAERIEVLKGPSALLNGMPPSGNVGGAVNVVTKRASAEPLTRIGVTYMSDSVFGTQVDIGRRFGEAQEFGVRFNGAYRDGDTTIDRQSLTETVGALGLDYSGEKLRLSADVIYQHEDIDNVVRQFTLPPPGTVTDIPGAPDNDLNYPGYGYSKMGDRTLALRGEYDFNEHLTAYAGYGDRDSKMNAVAGNPTINDNDGNFSSVAMWQVFGIRSHSAEAGLHAAFSTGAIEHQVTVGATRVIQNADIFFVPAGGLELSNLDDPVRAGPTSTAGWSAHAEKYTTITLTSYAVADTLSFFEDRFELTLGARRQQVEQQQFVFGTTEPYDKSSTTPVVGVVFKPQPDLSLYANYIEGLSPGPQLPLGSVGAMKAPIKTKQHEAGVKYDWGRIATTVSVFQIKRPDVSGDNEQRNRGIELNVFGEIAPGVRLLGGGSYMDPELTKTANGADEGNDAVGVPREQVNLGSEWDMPFAPELTLTARAIYTGKQYLDTANDLPIPAWTRFDVGGRYKLNVFAKPVVLRANVDNLFNRNYWGASPFGYLYVGTPRTLQLSATVDF